MGEIFNLDNKFFQGIGRAVDCVCLNLIWLVFCIPIITAGAATTALYYTANKVIRHGRSYIWKEFYSSFKSNFKQSTIVWLIDLAIYAVLFFDCYVMYQYAKAGDSMGRFYLVFMILIALCVMWSSYLYPYMARFENTTKRVLKNALFIAISNLPWTILVFVIAFIAFMGLYSSPYIILIIPSVYMLIKGLIMERIFKKYMSPEDLAAEEERNREYLN